MTPLPAQYCHTGLRRRQVFPCVAGGGRAAAAAPRSRRHSEPTPCADLAPTTPPLACAAAPWLVEPNTGPRTETQSDVLLRPSSLMRGAVPCGPARGAHPDLAPVRPSLGLWVQTRGGSGCPEGGAESRTRRSRSDAAGRSRWNAADQHICDEACVRKPPPPPDGTGGGGGSRLRRPFSLNCLFGRWPHRGRSRPPKMCGVAGGAPPFSGATARRSAVDSLSDLGESGGIGRSASRESVARKVSARERRCLVDRHRRSAFARPRSEVVIVIRTASKRLALGVNIYTPREIDRQADR